MGTNRFTGITLATALAVCALAACERSLTNPVTPAPGKPPAVRAYATPLTADSAMGMFQVCSVGADATYTFSADSGNGSFAGPKTGSMTIVAGDCEIIYNGRYIAGKTKVNAVTITLSSIGTPNKQLSSLVGDSLFWHCQLNPLVCTTDDVQTNLGTATSVTYNINGDVGALGTFTYSNIPQPALTVTKTADSTSVAAGHSIGFRIIVTSTGNATAQNVVLNDVLPTGVGISWSISPAVAGCTITSNTLVCNFGSLPVDSSRTVHLVSPTTNGSCATYSNTATVSATGLASIQASASVTVTGCEKVCTATQGGWGQGANGRNIGWMRNTFWSTVYPSGFVTVGTGNHMTFTSAAAIENYLPAGSTPGVLPQNYTNPLTTPAGVFGGQVTALRLNVDFSNAGVNGWKPNLATTTIASGPLAGMTVAQVLAIAESVLGGGALPAGMSLGDLNELVSDINEMNSPDGCGFGVGPVDLP